MSGPTGTPPCAVITAEGGTVLLAPFASSWPSNRAALVTWEAGTSGHRTSMFLTREHGTQLRDALDAWLEPVGSVTLDLALDTGKWDAAFDTPAPAASSPVPQAATGTVADPPSAAAPVARDQRYGQCDSTCTVDCGHCKGAGAPAASPARTFDMLGPIERQAAAGGAA